MSKRWYLKLKQYLLHAMVDFRTYAQPISNPALTGSAWVEWRQLQQFLLRTSPSPSPPRKPSVLHESTRCSYRQDETPEGSHVSCTGGGLRKAVLLSAIVDPECTDELLSTHKHSFYPMPPEDRGPLQHGDKLPMPVIRDCGPAVRMGHSARDRIPSPWRNTPYLQGTR